MPVMTIGRTFAWQADRDADAIAVVDDDGAMTRREFDLASNRLARAYRELGVGVDDLVTIGLPNSVEYYLVCAAVWKAGGVPNPVSRRLPGDELAELIELAQPKLVVGLDSPGRTCLPAGFVADHTDAALDDVRASSWKAPVSSGSTGRPKIILSGTAAEVDPSAPTAGYIPARATQLVTGPLHHSAPFLFSMRGLMTGHTIVVRPRFDAQDALATIERHGVTWTLLVPAMMQRIWRLDPAVRTRYDLSSLESILHVGAPCAPWLKRAWIEWLGPDRIVEIYSGTESAGVTVIGGREWLEHPGSVGRAAPGFSFCVLDDEGRELPRGSVGEIHMRPRGGAGSTYRYVGAESRRVGDWESIGDSGRMDADGYVYLVDRSVDVITCDGVQLYPAEVEAVLDAHPAVRSSAVFGLPDDEVGERIHAVVEADASAEDLVGWVLAERPATPPHLSVEVVDRPVRDDAGKVRRSALRAERTSADVSPR